MLTGDNPARAGEVLLWEERSNNDTTERYRTSAETETDVEITDTLSKEVKRYIDEGKTLPWVMGGFPSGYEPKAAADFQGYFSGEYTFDQMVDQLKADFVELKK